MIDLSALRDLPTPSLVLDADALERNLGRMDEFLEGHGAYARPHTKTHKSPEIARLQLERSRTVGVCCARVAEAEALVAHDVVPVLVTSPIVTNEKIQRFVDLATRSQEVWTVVDSELGVDRLADECERRDTRCGVIVDLDPGFHRTGAPMGEVAVGLAQRILENDRLHLHGVQMYAGTLMHLEDPEERQSGAESLWREVDATVAAIRALGTGCEVITGGGTGTFDLDAPHSTPTDLQVGSYVFMDAQYRVIRNQASLGKAAPFDYFEPSLFVVAAAISQSVPHLVTVDAGFKALASDHVPEVVGHEGMRFHYGGDEHGMIQMNHSASSIAIDDRVALLVSHCDPTVNLHEQYVVLKGGVPVDTWKIAARGTP